MKRNTAVALAAVFVFGATGCARVEYVPLPPPPCPPMPALPVVKGADLATLSDDAYRDLVERELRLKEHIGQLRSMCDEKQ
jgi:hypothetical protein